MIPIVLRLRVADRLLRIVGAVANGKQHHLRCGVSAQTAGIGHGACAPIVAHEYRTIDAERVNKVQKISTKCRKLAAALRLRIQEARWAESA
ncbi:hypothetical protein D9M72_534300 [compost metagenome]